MRRAALAPGGRGEDAGRWLAHALFTSRRLAPEGMRWGAGRVRPFSLFVADAAFAAPRERKGLSATIPQIASLPGASPTFSHHDEVMLRMAAALTRGELTAPDVIAPSHPVQSASARLHA